MGFGTVVALFLVAGICAHEVHQEVEKPVGIDDLADTHVVLAFVIFRHGDRTPVDEELKLLASEVFNKNVFFPYGTGALTNRGKQRAYQVGQYIRRRYNGLISRLYLPDEIVVRTTIVPRTKMTALAALAAIYPPPPAQRWNPALDWQPVPYDTLPFDEDDFLYWSNCPRYLWLRDRTYELPEVASTISQYRELFKYLSQHTGTNITSPEKVLLLDGLFQALDNVNLKPPKWAQDVMPQIKAMTKIEFAVQTYDDELKRLAAGVLMADFVNATSAFISGNTDQPKMRLYSAHDINVATVMAATGVFKPHHPNYGSAFSLELRRHNVTGEYGVLMADFVNATSAFISGNTDQPKMRLYSAHDINVATVMAATGVFKPHHPNYGSAFSLELRRHNVTGEYGVTAVYAPVAGAPEQILKIKGCGATFCDYRTFLKLTENVLRSRDDCINECAMKY